MYGHIFYNNKNIAGSLLKKGYAFVDKSQYAKKDKYYETFMNLEDFAKKNQLGIWSDDKEKTLTN